MKKTKGRKSREDYPFKQVMRSGHSTKADLHYGPKREMVKYSNLKSFFENFMDLGKR
jgi:hypothetical protein